MVTYTLLAFHIIEGKGVINDLVAYQYLKGEYANKTSVAAVTI